MIAATEKSDVLQISDLETKEIKLSKQQKTHKNTDHAG